MMTEEVSDRRLFHGLCGIIFLFWFTIIAGLYGVQLALIDLQTAVDELSVS